MRGYGADLAVLVQVAVLMVVKAQAYARKKEEGGYAYQKVPSHTALF